MFFFPNADAAHLVLGFHGLLQFWGKLQGERVEHEGFLVGDLLKRFLMLPEEKQQAPA